MKYNNFKFKKKKNIVRFIYMIGLRGVVKGTQIKIMTKWKHPHDWLLLV